ncbi:uncharacterized protein LOC115633558 isoform X2 [Scaptodrosophila lebanonensis]|nr:uncharacterized protein LOC115629986 isoform X2 [Scaptodrosophila lebanonensis]XP_030382472.1 uncharacterized protein LOC115629987 isoform X2 [Scaptodrosophila lebanonensis]XP_030384899.1 uncharacterized protein LOC115632078 [Scaptodrosophila lebanonensis]XP_030385224.1 uncharacterized protein LOC115632277 isoform X2 [Scaptodrosophila lebanonensis]XP_030385226.1 uncharacterized protein LOC115632277 isoform X3 [Scaptodrosophila lebanonensis]XP_030385227.1 uncharacterized protein LOC115632278
MGEASAAVTTYGRKDGSMDFFAPLWILQVWCQIQRARLHQQDRIRWPKSFPSVTKLHIMMDPDTEEMQHTKHEQSQKVAEMDLEEETGKPELQAEAPVETMFGL